MNLLIRELRRQRGMTQRELAEKMQVSFQTISKWENGINLPDVTHLPKLAEIFGVRTDVILGLEPIGEKTKLRKFESAEYWIENRDLIKMWKEFYWNDDYFKFLVRFRTVYEQEDSYQGGIDYFMARGASFQKADEYARYLKQTKEYMDSDNAMLIKTSGLYFVYASV